MSAGKPNPVANIHARRALAYATDQQALADNLGPGVELPKSPIPSASKWGLPDDQTGYPDHDLDQAEHEVDLYKEETGAPSLSIELSLPTDPDSLAVAQMLQSQWKQAGIDTTLDDQAGQRVHRRRRRRQVPGRAVQHLQRAGP